MGSGLRLWHLMAAVAAAAVLAAVAADDLPCTPVAPVLAGAYACAGLGAVGGRWKGWGVRTGLLLGLLLGPIGVLVAFSNRPPAPGERKG